VCWTGNWVWTGERMDFDALQQRNVNTATTVRRRLAPAVAAAEVTAAATVAGASGPDDLGGVVRTDEGETPTAVEDAGAPAAR